MKKIITLCSLCLMVFAAKAQTSIFWETFGTTAVSAEPLRPYWTAGGPAASNLNIVINSQDTPTIVNGSGMGNLINSKTSGTLQGIATYTLGGGAVSTVGYHSIKVIWACRKTASDSTDVSLEWSADSVTWNALTFAPDTAIHPVRWVLSNDGAEISLPGTAENVSNLRFRFTLNRTGSAANAGNYRIDDFKVLGTAIVAGVDDITAGRSQLQVAPNPVQDNMVITHPSAVKNAVIEIFSTSGSLMGYTVKPSVNSRQSQINVSRLPAGIYTIRFTNGSKKYTTRLVKN